MRSAITSSTESTRSISSTMNEVVLSLGHRLDELGVELRPYLGRRLHRSRALEHLLDRIDQRADDRPRARPRRPPPRRPRTCPAASTAGRPNLTLRSTTGTTAPRRFSAPRMKSGILGTRVVSVRSRISGLWTCPPRRPRRPGRTTGTGGVLAGGGSVMLFHLPSLTRRRDQRSNSESSSSVPSSS